MKLKIICLVSYAIFFSKVEAQDIGSLLLKLKTAPQDTSTIRLLNKIGFRYMSNNVDSAFFYIEAAKKLSEKLSYKMGVINYYINMHGIFIEKGNYDSSLIIVRQGLLLAEKTGEKKEMALCYENISSSYHYLLKFDSCTFYDLKALKLLEELNDRNELVILYGNLCESYSEQHQYRKAIDFGLKAKKLSKEGFGDDNDLLYVLYGLSETYLKMNKNDSAQVYANECLTLCKQEKNYTIEQLVWANMILIKINEKKYDELMPIVIKLKELGKEFNTQEYVAQLNYNYSLANFYTGKTKLAEKYALTALKISEPNKLQFISENCYTILDKIESALGNYALADQFASKRDSLNNEKINQLTGKNIQELEAKYNSQKKENEILKLQQDNQKKSILNKIFLGSIAALFLVAFLGYRNFKNKQQIAQQTAEIQQQKIIELEKDKQISAIDFMMKGQEEERSRIAKDLHDGLGGLLSGTKLSFMNVKENLVLTPENAAQFDKSLGMLDITISDLRKVAHNLMPEALVKFGLQDAVRDFCDTIQSSSGIQIKYQQFGEQRKLTNTTEVFTYRIIQELVNNAVKYAAANEILVQLTIATDKISITVEDDGKGFDKNTLLQNKGAGMDNINYRVQYFNGIVDIVTAPGNGTSINIELKA